MTDNKLPHLKRQSDDIGKQRDEGKDQSHNGRRTLELVQSRCPPLVVYRTGVGLLSVQSYVLDDGVDTILLLVYAVAMLIIAVRFGLPLLTIIALVIAYPFIWLVHAFRSRRPQWHKDPAWEDLAPEERVSAAIRFDDTYEASPKRQQLKRARTLHLAKQAGSSPRALTAPAAEGDSVAR